VNNTSPLGKRFWLKAAIGLGITLGLFYLLFSYIDLHQLAELFSRTRWGLWLSGIGFWTIIYLSRAKRFCALAPRTPYLTMLCIAAVHNLLLRLLPFRTGELAYAFLVKRAGTAGLGESLFSLLLLRILDSTMVVILFAAALAFHQGTYLGDRTIGLLAASGVALAGIVMILFLVPMLRLGLRLGRWVLSGLKLAHRARVSALLQKIGEAVETFAEAQRSTLLQISSLSLVQWLLTFGAFHALMLAFGIPVTLSQTVLGSTAAVVTSFLPIGGIGSFGTLEAGWALGFVLVGLDKEVAISSGFGVSISTFIFNAILGLLGWAGLALLG
jgi:glycosyltransferase 2 family protein